MAYIGKQPTVGNFQVCDAISVVNGQAAYTLQVGGVNVAPESANHMLVSLNGILQKPGSSFTISGSTMTFASNLATGDVIDFVQILGNVLDLGQPSDDTVKTASLQANAVTGAKLNADVISAQTALGAEPADTDEFLVSDAGVLKRMDYSYIKSSPGLVLLTSGDITSTTSTFAINSTYVNDTYDHYQLWLRGKDAGDGIQMSMRFRNDADNAYVTSNYSWRIGELADNGGGTNTEGADSIRISYQHPGSGANEGFNMVLDFMSPRSNLVPTGCHWKIAHADTGDQFHCNHGGARRNDGTEKHSGFILFFESGGDFANGTNYEFYGLKK